MAHNTTQLTIQTFGLPQGTRIPDHLYTLTVTTVPLTTLKLKWWSVCASWNNSGHEAVVPKHIPGWQLSHEVQIQSANEEIIIKLLLWIKSCVVPPHMSCGQVTKGNVCHQNHANSPFNMSLNSVLHTSLAGLTEFWYFSRHVVVANGWIYH